MAETYFDEWIARRYEMLWPELFEPPLLDAAVDFLAEMAGTDVRLSLGSVPIASRCRSPVREFRCTASNCHLAMVAELERQENASEIGETIGDFATTNVDASFRIVYVLRNTITNLTTQDEQVTCFRNAARHLEPGGFFVVENYIPELRRLPPGENRHVFIATPTHVAIGEYDLANQIETSRHWWLVEGELKTFASDHRYVWPAELDLMAHMTGLTLRQRWSDWYRAPFTSESRSHISVWQSSA